MPRMRTVNMLVVDGRILLEWRGTYIHKWVTRLLHLKGIKLIKIYEEVPKKKVSG